MDLTPEQTVRAKILFEYEEAKKALTERRDDIQIWAKALIAAGEALMNHPGTIVIDGVAGSSDQGEASSPEEPTVNHNPTERGCPLPNSSGTSGAAA